jgi:hypothetical protein
VTSAAKAANARAQESNIKRNFILFSLLGPLDPTLEMVPNQARLQPLRVKNGKSETS